MSTYVGKRPIRQRMKILVLSPNWSADPQLAKSLQAYGIHALVANDSAEAWQVLKFHASSVELLVVQREEGASRSLEFVKRCKADPAHRELPLVILSSEWSASEFTAHQGTPEGANAYLTWPCSAEELARAMGGVLGREFAAAKAPPPFTGVAPGATNATKKTPFDVKVEAVDDVFSASTAAASPSQIRLDAPVFEPSQATVNLSALPQAPAAELVTETTLTSLAPLLAPASDASIELVPANASEPVLAPQPTFAPEPVVLAAEPPPFTVSAPTPPSPPAIEEVEFIAPQSESASVSATDTDSASDSDSASESEMPYLFGRSKPTSRPSAPPRFEHPVGDSIVPGGAAQSPDTETLKKYLLLREQDVAALSGQLKATRAENHQIAEALKQERARVAELEHLETERQRDNERFERERQLLMDAHRAEIAEIKFQAQAKSDRVRALELEVRGAGSELERIKERVRSDLRKIRTREKDLETKLELSRKDSETLVAAREAKIIELKRKVDLLEFNLDVIQNQLAKERDNGNQLKERLLRAKQAVKAAGGLLAADSGPGAPEAGAEEAS